MAIAVRKLSPQVEADLAEAIGQFHGDPYGFVMFAYPWKQEFLPDGSPNPLREKDGPEDWQKKILVALGEHIRNNVEALELLLQMDVWRSAVVSGHGVGKSALVAWIVQFLMSTRPDTRGIVTANTQRQLEDKTWPELSKWHNMLINKHWFTWTATSYYFSQYPDEKRKNYMVTAMTVSADNTEAFAGLHNEGKSVFVIFDEASGIDAKVWEVATGAFTDGEGFFFAYGNPTRPDGAFADCFDKNESKYYTDHVDSRSVSHTNKKALQDIIDLYGGIRFNDDGSIDCSDAIKIRVLGMFPNQAYNGFISREAVEDAIRREFVYDAGAPLIMAVDVARYGDDETVIGFRQGRDARSFKYATFKGLSIVKVADIAMDFANKRQPDAIVIESTGVGAGVIDIMRSRSFKVVEVHPGSPSKYPLHYYNKRAELWSLMRDWIIAEGCLQDDPIMVSQLTSILYELDRHEQRIKLEPKDEMKARTGLSSPDRADTLALTFGVHLARRDSNLTRLSSIGGVEATTDYDPRSY